MVAAYPRDIADYKTTVKVNDVVRLRGIDEEFVVIAETLAPGNHILWLIPQHYEAEYRRARAGYV